MAEPHEKEPSSLEKTTTTSVYIQSGRVERLNRGANRVNYETNSPKTMSPSALARYTLDNFLDAAIQKLIADAKYK